MTRRKIPVTVMEPLLGGRLSEVPNHIVAQLKERKPELSVASWAFRYTGSMPGGLNPAEAHDENYREARRAFLIGYDRSVPKLRQANHCIGCKQCIPHCPQAINIPEEMHRIDAYVERLKQDIK